MDVKDVECWATTLREIHEHIPFQHRSSIRDLVHTLEGMLVRHQRQHEEVVTEAPTIEDLMDYLASYARHV